jgi:hypothetical protein
MPGSLSIIHTKVTAKGAGPGVKKLAAHWRETGGLWVYLGPLFSSNYDESEIKADGKYT